MARRLGIFVCYSAVAVAFGLSFSGVASAESLELTAKFTSHPPKWEEGKATLPKDAEFTLPARVELVEGASTNAAAVLVFKSTAEKFAHHCIYRGGGLGLWDSIVDFFRKVGLVLTGKLKFADLFSGGSSFAFTMCTGNAPKAGDIALGKEFTLKLHTMNAKNKERIVVAKAVLELKDGTVPTPTPTATATPTGTPTATPTATVAPTPTVTPTPEPANLPPDPGEAGKVTIEGIDSDGDGVRDDVQRWIYFNVPETPAVQEGAKHMARILARTLLSVNDKVQNVRDSKAALTSVTCFKTLFRRADPAKTLTEVQVLSAKIRAEIFNTEARLFADFQTDRNLSGDVWYMPDNEIDACPAEIRGLEGTP